MKTLWFPTLLIILFNTVKSSAQSAGNFTTFETIPCPFDAAKTIKAYKNWLIYQTMDGTWSGQIDSSRCISLANSPSDGILLQDVDLSRPVFLRSKFTQTSPAYLEKNMLYITYAGISWQSTNYGLLSGSNCPENLCSGIFVGIEIPDSTGLGTAIRWYTDIADSNTANGTFETCIPTEYFDYNYLKEFIIKLSFDSTTQSSAKIKMAGAGLDSWALNGYVYDIVAPEWTFEDTSYNVPVSYVATDVNGWNNNYLLMYNDIGNWPSSAHPSYVEGKPQNNTPDPKTINLIVSSGENLIAQPFTIVRGALEIGRASCRERV